MQDSKCRIQKSKEPDGFMALLPEVESKLERERKGIREENTVGSFYLT